MYLCKWAEKVKSLYYELKTLKKNHKRDWIFFFSDNLIIQTFIKHAGEVGVGGVGFIGLHILALINVLSSECNANWFPLQFGLGKFSEMLKLTYALHREVTWPNIIAVRHQGGQTCNTHVVFPLAAEDGVNPSGVAEEERRNDSCSPGCELSNQFVIYLLWGTQFFRIQRQPVSRSTFWNFNEASILWMLRVSRATLNKI